MTDFSEIEQFLAANLIRLISAGMGMDVAGFAHTYTDT